MKAIMLSEFGDENVMTLAEVPDLPAPEGDSIRIKVAAAGVNRADLLQRQGHYPPPAGESDVLGLEVSGTIDALGPDVVGWRVGDEVCALLAGGGYAEYAIAPATQCLPVPVGVALVDAAALPEVACTVHSNVVTEAGLRDIAPEGFTSAVEEGQSPSAADRAAMEDLLTTRTVKAFIYNTQAVDAVTEALLSIAKSANVPVVEFTETLPDGVTDYVVWQGAQIDALTAANSG